MSFQQFHVRARSGMRLAAAGLFWLMAGVSVPTMALPVTVKFSGLGIYDQVAGGETQAQVGDLVHFMGGFTYDTTWSDQDSSPNTGLYHGSAPATYWLSWLDGYTCNWFCPEGFLPHQFIPYGRPAHYLDSDSLDITIRDGAPGTTQTDVWSVGTRADDTMHLRWVESALLDLGQPGILDSDALGLPPTLEMFNYGSFISVTYADCDYSQEPRCAFGPFTEYLHWRGSFMTFEQVSDAASVRDVSTIPEPPALVLLALAGLATRIRRRHV